ncbi:hypothetical protein BKK54_05975 [Rodentibacter genomosp. 1]|uniref:Uncharacterized protein n=1 Tax=Rodentibacter genomosp. 1 TaxID=1908264 RepID=A0A1V3J662_9PAST|nr:hypothetical protein [Rodentibacter genomosp. 1]OOF50631.1 hypothetical protein BKK54_05975 [Rodentibacter genomosp. 1]
MTLKMSILKLIEDKCKNDLKQDPTFPVGLDSETLFLKFIRSGISKALILKELQELINEEKIYTLSRYYISSTYKHN